MFASLLLNVLYISFSSLPDSNTFPPCTYSIKIILWNKFYKKNRTIRPAQELWRLLVSAGRPTCIRGDMQQGFFHLLIVLNDFYVHQWSGCTITSISFEAYTSLDIIFGGMVLCETAIMQQFLRWQGKFCRTAFSTMLSASPVPS